MTKKTKDLIITLQNHIQFQSIKVGIDLLIQNGIDIDLYIPIGSDDIGYSNMYEDLYKYLKKQNYNIIRKINEDNIYKILLEPYPMDFYGKTNYKYRLKYKYSSISAKPNPVYKPEHNICYDGILCFGKYEANCLEAYTRTYIIENLKYINYNKKTNQGKHTLLYLPTFGNVSSIENIVKNIPNIKKEYKFITKFHHATSFLNDEKRRLDELEEMSDECYDQSTELIDLLSIADVVLTDNSGSIFEAIYADVPVCVFSKDINANKLENFNTPQFEIIGKDIIPYTDNPNEIVNILKKATSKEYINKRKEAKNNLFVKDSSEIIGFVNVINKYLNDDIDINYKKIHDILKNDYYSKNEKNIYLSEEIKKSNNANNELKVEVNKLNNANNELKLEVNKLNKVINEKDNILYYYQTKKLYKLAEKLYRLKNKIMK